MRPQDCHVDQAQRRQQAVADEGPHAALFLQHKIVDDDGEVHEGECDQGTEADERHRHRERNEDCKQADGADQQYVECRVLGMRGKIAKVALWQYLVPSHDIEQAGSADLCGHAGGERGKAGGECKGNLEAWPAQLHCDLLRGRIDIHKA